MAKGTWVFIPETKEAAGGGGIILGILIFIFIGLRMFVEWLTHWKDYSFPAKQIAALYYYGFVLPVKGLLYPWRLIRTEALTPYPNINLILAILAILLVFALTAMLVMRLFRAFGKTAWVTLLTFLIGPWMFWGVWLAYKWLTAPQAP